ncbi:MAG: LemA family protein [Patescibacteria group bacterium]|nr:LemA family protein [Patescibacteria group bacterium]
MTAFFWVSITFGTVAFLILVYLWSVYNGFVVERNQVKTDYSDIDIQLKRRASLIEQLAALVKDYAKHEKETFENVSRARAALDTSKTAGQAAKAENMLSQTLRSLFSVVENYPKLLANESFQGLREDLKETENLIAKYREEYNKTVQNYNNLIQTFPNLLAASVFQFHEEELFQEMPEAVKEDGAK